MNKKNSLALPCYDSPLELKEILDGLGFSMQKKFGQNFLINRKIREEILSFVNIKAGTKIWEVGPGLGAMTEIILQKKASVTAFEIDKGFASLLSFFFPHPDFSIVLGDVQKTWKEEALKNGFPDILFGNLPYNISLEFIFSVIANKQNFPPKIPVMLFTMQKEAAQRITAKTGSKNYTALSVIASMFYDCKIIKLIPPTAFWPQPHVESAIILFTAKKELQNIPHIFTELVKSLFSSRRKTLKNNLTAWLKIHGVFCKTDSILQKAKLEANIRAENLNLYDFLRLSDIVQSVITEKQYEKQ